MPTTDISLNHQTERNNLKFLILPAFYDHPPSSTNRTVNNQTVLAECWNNPDTSCENILPSENEHPNRRYGPPLEVHILHLENY